MIVTVIFHIIYCNVIVVFRVNKPAKADRTLRKTPGEAVTQQHSTIV